ncbi:hypothetical protein LTR37_018772 [Vermiconidia calcicola]|uniref:Uncharacterized protein n=1 Tax=Vermiconidia calcicola TaxID=1690605 RepID=A0ACC3MHW9_9PEZI|nr:hypothetical protein LTR37_018772 [Vermiconidia calcicola]
MNQVLEPHPSSFAFNPQGYSYQALQSQDQQAFAYSSQHRYNDGVRSAASTGGRGMMQMQAQSPFTAPSDPYTTATYSQSVPAQAPFAAVQPRQSASPVRRFSPNAGNHSQPSSQTPPTKYPMAAPPLPQTPASQQQPPPPMNTHNAPGASPTSPQSPGSQSREQQRIALLLSINMDLLKEVNRLQEVGEGGAISPQQALQLRNAGQSDKMASEAYIQCLRRVQANLSYMSAKAKTGEQGENKAPPGPAHMTPPTHMPQIKEKYDQLKELFPDWPGLDHRMSGTSSSPRPNAQAGYANGMNANNASMTQA